MFVHQILQESVTPKTVRIEEVPIQENDLTKRIGQIEDLVENVGFSGAASIESSLKDS